MEIGQGQNWGSSAKEKKKRLQIISYFNNAVFTSIFRMFH
jgi:hypothetical protein